MCQEMQRVPQVGKGRPDAGVEAPQAWAVLPGTPSPFLSGFLPKPFLETQPIQPPITGPMFPWWLTGPGQAEPFLSLSILRVWENSLVGRRSTPQHQPVTSHPTKSLSLRITGICSWVYFLAKLWDPQTMETSRLPGACAGLCGQAGPP